MNGLIQYFLGRNVTVKADRFNVKGKLIACQDESKSNHKPCVLVLETEHGSTIIRGSWTSINEEHP